MLKNSPIGIFDSGLGGLTILTEIKKLLPSYDYLYLGDNARAPYGNRSFETVYEFTLQCVKWFFDQGCELVILACNTASAKALRTIQQNDLSQKYPGKRVLGVIRPTSEIIGDLSITKTIGILGTKGTVQSNSYIIEIEKFFPGINVYQQECPLWVALIESGEYDNEGADYFIKKNINQLLSQSSNIDIILLACTHYPLLINKIQSFIPSHIKIVTQGKIVAKALESYFFNHQDLNARITQNSTMLFYTTDDINEFDKNSKKFYSNQIESKHIDI